MKISTTPSCTCEDYHKTGGRELCQHIIWVYLYVLHVEETSDLLQQITLSEENVSEILFTEEAKSILSKDKRNGKELQWYLLRKEEETDLGENTLFTARRCNNEFRPGDLCLKVKGLQVVNNQKPVEECLFYFCPSRDCIKQFPLNSNLKFPAKVFIREGSHSAKLFDAIRDGFPQLKNA